MLDQRRLSRTGMADNTEKFAPFHPEIHIIQSNMLKGRAHTVNMGEAARFNHGCHEHSSVKARIACAQSSKEMASKGR